MGIHMYTYVSFFRGTLVYIGMVFLYFTVGLFLCMVAMPPR
jgi:hypothetical protein